MYGDPRAGLYGHKPNPKPKRKRGRPSQLLKFLEKQVDMFEAQRLAALARELGRAGR